MGIVLIDNQEVEIGDDERLNGIQVAARAGVDVSHVPGANRAAKRRDR